MVLRVAKKIILLILVAEALKINCTESEIGNGSIILHCAFL